MAGALDGVRVVDFGQYIAGPLLGMLLADQGADVIRIEPPGGPLWDTSANATWNRGKRSVTLDLKVAADLEVAHQLVAGADALVENFRPGVMERLGLGPAVFADANPGLVYCRLPGFAADDERAALPAWEGVIGAATGTYLGGLEGGGAGERAIFTAVPISSSYAAFLGAATIAAALVEREASGHGQVVEVPLFDATFTAIGLRGLKVQTPPPGPPRRASGWVRQYPCRDGRWVQFHAANSRFIRQFAKAAGIEDWAADGLLDPLRVSTEPALGRLLGERMQALFLTRTAQEWEDLVNAAGTPTAICRESAEWLQHPHARATAMVVEVDDPMFGRMLQPGITPRLDGTPGELRRPAPLPGADTAAVRAEVRSLERPPRPDASPLSAAGPLAGIKVLDLCIILAGPTCGRTLAEFGADVIKIDQPDREGGVAFHNDVNRGKKSLLLDLRKPEGLDVFWTLLADADVVVQNYRAGAIDRLGVGYEAIRQRRPDIVYASLNCYGHGGPWEGRPGWEQLAQAATGMQARYGGDQGAVLQPFPVNDYGTGILGAYAVMLALRHRQRTGEGQHVRSALAYTACTLQSAFLMDYEGKTWDEPRGREALGSGPLQRLYQASDGWFFLGARSWAELAAAGLPTDEAALEEVFASEPARKWTARLAAAAIGAHEAITVDALMADPWVVAHGLAVTREHEGLGLVTTNGPGQRMSRSAVVPGAPASLPGADARAVLEAHGLGDRIERLVRSGALTIEATR